MKLEELIHRRNHARAAVRSILGDHESAPSRVIELRESLKKLSGLPADIAEYYQEALRALETGCFRAAIVFAWAGFIYSLTAKLVQGYQTELSTHYSKWKFSTTEELLEATGEFQVLEAAKKCGLIKSQQLHIYKGWLTTRNQCAHPTLHLPSRNASLGFVDNMIAEVSFYI